MVLNALTALFMIQADCIEGRLLVNPGSATGAFNTFRDNVVPSFVLMDISSKKVGPETSGAILLYVSDCRPLALRLVGSMVCCHSRAARTHAHVMRNTPLYLHTF